MELAVWTLQVEGHGGVGELGPRGRQEAPQTVQLVKALGTSDDGVLIW
jgi:hypothetical protein